MRGKIERDMYFLIGGSNETYTARAYCAGGSYSRGDSSYRMAKRASMVDGDGLLYGLIK